MQESLSVQTCPLPDFHNKTEVANLLFDKWMSVLLQPAQEKQITLLMERNWDDICATDLPHLQINYFSLELSKLQEEIWPRSKLLTCSSKTWWRKLADTKAGWKGPPKVQPFMGQRAHIRIKAASFQKKKCCLAVCGLESFGFSFKKQGKRQQNPQ